LIALSLFNCDFSTIDLTSSSLFIEHSFN
jgi:hypothetical protein